jgi:hypothetical protein
MQFLKLEMNTWQADAGTSLKSYGQFGQVNIINGEYSPIFANSSCPSMMFTGDYRQTQAPTAVDTGLNFVTSGQELSTGLPVRIIGTNLPSGLSTGATYFVRRYDMGGSGGADRLSLHTTRANVSSNTRIALGSTGTLGNWFVCPLYVTSVGVNVLNFDLPHHLVDGELVTVVGTSLPSGLVAATNYYVIRITARQIRLSASRANAFAGIAITFSGGTVTLFGLSAAGNSSLSSYSVNLSNVTIQNTISALYVVNCQDIQANLHIENVKNSIYCRDSHLAINGGLYANPANDGGAGVLLYAIGINSRISVNNNPCVQGTVDKLISSVSGPVYSQASGGFVRSSTSRTTGQTSGLAQQFGVSATVDIGAADFCFFNTSATTITNLSTKHGPRTQIKIVAWSGSIVFGTGGNLLLPITTPTVVLPQNACAVFELIDTIGTWVLVSKSG